jgi:hypothetical protein
VAHHQEIPSKASLRGLLRGPWVVQIRRVLAAASREEAARILGRILGIDPSTLDRKRKQCGI